MDISPETRILLVLPFFYPHRGGSQKYAEELYAKLMELHPNVKVDVLCYNTDNVAPYEEYRGFSIIRIPCINVIPTRFALAFPIPLLKALFKLKKNHYDIVNTHIRFFDPTWWLWAYAKLINAKSIFTGHVVGHPVHQKRFVEMIGKIVDLTIAQVSLKFYDYLTFTNKAAMHFFTDKLGVNDKKATLIYGGIDTAFFSPLEQQIIRNIPKVGTELKSDDILVTFVGRLIWTKGVTFLYEAIVDICKMPNTKNIKFVLAGPGELEAQMRENIARDGLTDRVILTGNMSYTEVRDLLRITDIFINPSNHNEGFPNTVLEAGACGCYVIATDNAGTNEVVINGKTGALVPQKDPDAFKTAILWAVQHSEERKSISKEYRQMLVDNFDWSKIAEQFYQKFIVQTL